MATSLAKQLQKLKVEQKDEIVLPQRTKISFLFDIKQAANIDDQSLYFLCLNALNQIQKSNTDLFIKLKPFQQNILNESSLNFYRGTQTKEQLKSVESQIQSILAILSSYYMTDQETHKIIEYLIRIYEINAFHKYDLIYGFLPYYETVWFMKICQLVNLKEDKWLEWINEFSYKGEQVSKQVLIRAMQRNQASLFDQYAKWLLTQESDDRVNIHHQFLGYILSNILQEMLHSNKNTGSIEYQQTLYTLLPHISKCMRQNSSKELISTGFMAIGYLGCGKGQESRLTPEYAKAFLKQVIITLKQLSDENGGDHIKLSGIKVLSGLLEFQKGISLDVTDVISFLQINKIVKLIITFQSNYDVSQLMVSICETIKNSKDHQLFEVFSKFLSKIQLNMKTFYLMLTNLIYQLTDLKDKDQILSNEFSATLNLINFLKQYNRQFFDKIIIHILKQNFNIAEFKQNLCTIVNSNEENKNIDQDNNPLIKPFSLLSALCSQRKQVQQNALISLNDQKILESQFVSKQELSLIVVHLCQMLSETINNESIALNTVQALKTLTLRSKDIQYDVDFVFQKIEYAIHLRGMIEMHQDDQINKQLDQNLLEFAIFLQPQLPSNLKLQAYLSYFFEQNINQNQNQLEIAQFLSEMQKKKLKKVDHILNNQDIALEFVQDIIGSQEILGDTFIDQKNKNMKRSYFNLEQADYIISVLAEQKKDEAQEVKYFQNINKIFLIIQQTVYDKNDCEIISKILTSLIKSFPEKNNKQFDDTIKNLIIICLVLKQQFCNDFNMLILHNLLFKQYFKSDHVSQLKFYMNVILDCNVSDSNQLYQDLQQLLFVFSIKHIKNFIESKTFMIDWASIIVIILAILESSNQFRNHQLKIKQMAIQLAEAVLESSQSSKLEFKDIYDSSVISTQQELKQNKQDKYTPVKPQIAQQFLQNLVDNKTSILQDDSQMKQILKNILKSDKSQGKQTFFLNLVRVLPKLQSVFAKQTLLKQLLTDEKQSVVFMMALSDILQQQIQLFEKGSFDEIIVIRNIGKLIISQCALEKDETDPEKIEFVRLIVESLSLNLLKFCAKNINNREQFDNNVINELNTTLKEQANQIYNNQIICILKEDSQFKLLKIHLQINKHFQNKNQKSNLSNKFIQQSNLVFSGEQLSILFNDQINEMRQNLFDQNKLQSLLEVTTQLKVKNSDQCMQTILILLKKLVNISEKQNVSIQISMMCLMIDEIVASNDKNLQSLKLLKIEDEISSIVLNAVQNLFLPQLTSYIQKKGTIDEDDPFNQFMDIIGDEEHQEQEKDEDLFDKIIIQMQIIRDLNRIISSTEKTLYGIAKKANSSLNEIANYLKNIKTTFQDGEHRQFSQKEERIIRHLFRFYYTLVKQTLEIFQMEEDQNDEIVICLQRELLSQFIQTIQKISINKNDSKSKILSQENTFEQYKKYLIDIVNVCGIQQHGHLAFIFLFLFDDIQESEKKNDYQLELLLSSFKQIPQENSLSLLSNLLCTICQLQINISAQENYKLKDKLKILDSTLPDQKSRLVKASAFWLSSQFQQLQDQKMIIQLKSRIINQIDKWVNNDAFKQHQNQIIQSLTEIVQKQTLDGNSTPQWIKDEFLWFNLSLGVIKDEINFIQQIKALKTNKSSVKLSRLSTFTDKLLKNLNEMISLEIHSAMVHKIMKIQDEDSLSLKTNSIQILIQKTPNFFLEVSKQNQAHLSPIFSPLIQEACNFIKEQKQLLKQLKKNQDMRNYLSSLFALIQQTSNENLPQSLKRRPLELAFEIQDELKLENKKVNLTLHSQILICQSHLFEVYYQSQSVIEYLPQYTDMIIQQALNSQIYFKNQHFFSVSYIQTLMKAILSLISINYQYLGDTDKWEQLLKLLIVFDQKFSQELEQILLTFIEKAPIAIGDENNLQAVFNTFSEILIAKGCKNQDELTDISLIAIRFFKILLFNICKNIQKQSLKEHYMIIGEFFKNAMDFPGIFFKYRNVDIAQIDDIEKEIVESFQQFVIKLNEEQMGQIVLLFVKWSKKNKKNSVQNENDLGFNLHRQLIFNKVMCGTLETLGEYAVPYIQYQLQNIIDVTNILINSIKSVDDSNKKRSKLLQQHPNILDSQSIDGQGHTFVKLLRYICLNLTLNFSKDINSFIQADIFEKIAEPVVSELITLSQMKKHFKPFIDEILKPLIFEMIDRIDNSQLQIQLNNSILMKSRQNYKPETRLASLEIELYLFTKLGERYLIVLNDTLPFLSESLEDDDHDVEMAAKEVIKKIETLTGESIQEYLK